MLATVVLLDCVTRENNHFDRFFFEDDRFVSDPIHGPQMLTSVLRQIQQLISSQGISLVR